MQVCRDSFHLDYVTSERPCAHLIGIITAARAVDGDFVNICLVPMASFECLWDAFGFPCGDFGFLLAAFGTRYTLGLPFAFFEASWGTGGIPLGHLGLPGPPFKIGSPFSDTWALKYDV